MKKHEIDLSKGLWSLPPFPLVLVTVKRNIMTAGAFHFFSFKPPSVMVGIMPERYTYELFNQEGEFGINIPTTDQIHVVRTCGSISGREEKDKYKKAGITPFQGTKINTNLIHECPLNMECVVTHTVDYQGTHQWFIGEIQAVHVSDSYARDDALMFWGGEYRHVGSFIEKTR